MQDSLANITRAIEKGIFTDDLLQRAEQLENEKAKLETRLHELKLLEPLQLSRIYLQKVFHWKKHLRLQILIRKPTRKIARNKVYDSVKLHLIKKSQSFFMAEIFLV